MLLPSCWVKSHLGLGLTMEGWTVAEIDSTFMGQEAKACKKKCHAYGHRSYNRAVNKGTQLSKKLTCALKATHYQSVLLPIPF